MMFAVNGWSARRTVAGAAHVLEWIVVAVASRSRHVRVVRMKSPESPQDCRSPLGKANGNQRGDWRDDAVVNGCQPLPGGAIDPRKDLLKRVCGCLGARVLRTRRSSCPEPEGWRNVFSRATYEPRMESTRVSVPATSGAVILIGSVPRFSGSSGVVSKDPVPLIAKRSPRGCLSLFGNDSRCLTTPFRGAVSFAATSRQRQGGTHGERETEATASCGHRGTRNL